MVKAGASRPKGGKKPGDDADELESLNDVGTAVSVEIGQRTGPPRVLLVEDEVLVSMVATEQLQDLGYRVETAGSATEAMNKVKLMGDELALAIVDIGLPDVKGDVLVAEMRARHPHLPIVVASGYDDPDLRRRFANDGHIAFMRKPYTQQDLRKALPPLQNG